MVSAVISGLPARGDAKRYLETPHLKHYIYRVYFPCQCDRQYLLDLVRGLAWSIVANHVSRYTHVRFRAMSLVLVRQKENMNVGGSTKAILVTFSMDIEWKRPSNLINQVLKPCLVLLRPPP
jgi:hypothetical protein